MEVVMMVSGTVRDTHTRKLDAEESGFFVNFLGGRSVRAAGALGGTEVHRECSWLGVVGSWRGSGAN